MNGAFMQVDLKYLSREKNRHGKECLYVRRYGKRIRLHKEGQPGFAEEVAAALAKLEAKQAKPKRGRAVRGTFRWLAEQYFASAAFKGLKPETQRRRRNIINNLSEEWGEKPFSQLRPRHIRKKRDARSEQPAAANAILKALRPLLDLAVDDELIEVNPAKQVPYLSEETEGYHSWTPEEIEQFEATHPVGSKPRLAMALLAFLGVRRSDVVALGRQHIKNGEITFKVQKRGKGKPPKTLVLPVLPELQAIIDATTTGNMAFLVTEYGKPFTSAGFGNWFRNQCVDAGVPGRAHGLRKAGAALAAERGATESQLMAIFGWETWQEARRYTRAARQRVLAGAAMPLLGRSENENCRTLGSEAVAPEENTG